MQIVFLLGATSTGKSEIAADLALLLRKKSFVSAIVNSDSRQVYKDLNIGTGKIEGFLNKEGFYIYKKVKHYLIDYIDPRGLTSLKTVFDYYFDFLSLFKNGDLNNLDYLIITGGTGLYAKIIYRENFKIETPKQQFKERYGTFKNLLEQLSLKTLQLWFKHYIFYKNDLKLNDSDINNAVRLRSQLLKLVGSDLEWFEDFLHPNNLATSSKKHLFHLKKDFKDLKKTIEKRVQKRIDEGLLEEVQNLLKSGVKESFLIKIGLDYRLTVLYLKGFLTQKEWQKKIVLENIKYAKRQLTWFKKEGLTEVFSLDDIIKKVV
jgi:tRNA dimethylallyltransferase